MNRMLMGQFFVWIAAIILVIGIIGLLVSGYVIGWEPSGIPAYESPVIEEGRQFERAKTVWDWMQLAFIPAALLFVGNLLNRREQEIADERARAAVLEAYLDRMTGLMLEHRLRESPSNEEVRLIAGARTLTALKELDGGRKRILLEFLWRSRLIDRIETVVDLFGADLRNADLRGVDLGEAVYGIAIYDRARYAGDEPNGANLGRLDLREADLREANLSGANLIGSDLRGAQLHGALLRRTALNEADLRGAKGLTREQLADANTNERTRHSLDDPR